MNLDESCAEVTVSSSVSSSMKEEVVQSNDNDGNCSSPGRSSPDTNCPICLGKLENKSFTDSCLHQFCFKCLLEWSKVKAECPLCKQSFKSIIHNVRSIEDYEQYYLSTTSTEGTLFVSREIFARLESPDATYREPPNLRFRTTAVSSYLDYFVRLEEAISHRVLPPGPSISGGTLWHRRRQRGTSDFRRNIYQVGLWVQRTSDITGRVRECSPEFYRANPAQVHRLVPWLNRELNVLLYENSPHIQHVMTRILELITQVPIRSPGFAAVVAPYIGRNTEHFVHEFHSFAISPFDMIGYDRHASYVGRNEIIDYSSALDSDSDVQVLEDTVGNPSPLIQLEDTDSNDCIVLDPPTRTQPEVITLDSDDDDVVQISIQTQTLTTSPPPQPSTSRRRLKRNWLTVNNIQVPSTSTNDNFNGCEISISIAHPGRSRSPSISEDSSSSWKPGRSKPGKVKKRGTLKRKSRKGKALQVPTLRVVSNSDDESSDRTVARRKVPLQVPTLRVVSNSDDESSHSPVARRKAPLQVPTLRVVSNSDDESSDRTVARRKAPLKVPTLRVVSNSDDESSDRTVARRKAPLQVPTLRVVSNSNDESSHSPVARRKAPVALVRNFSENNGSERTRTVDEKPPISAPRKRKLSGLSSISNESNTLYVDTDVSTSSSSSSESEYKPRLKSVVVKTVAKPELRTISPVYSPSHYRSESHDYDTFSPRSYSDLPSCSRSRSDSYRSTQSRPSRRSSSNSPDRLPSKRCSKYSKKRSRRNK